MTPSTRDRALTPPEITHRTEILLGLLDEEDELRKSIRASRDELRELRVEARKLFSHISQVRQEIRSGVVVESAQPELPHMDTRVEVDPAVAMSFGGNGARRIIRESEMGIDGSSDEPDPETDPPGAPVDKFFQLYPPPQDHASLVALLLRALGPEQEKLCRATVESWHPDSWIFAGAGWWARVEVAHQEGPGREPIAGLTLPVRYPMPRPLKEALGASQPKAKAGKKTRGGKA